MDFRRFWCGKRQKSLGLSALVLVLGACTTDEGNYFDDPPPPKGGHGGMAGVASAGRGGSGHGGTSAAGAEGAGRMGVGGDGATGGGAAGGTDTNGGTGGGATGGTGEGASGGTATVGGSGGTGGTDGGSGGSAGVGGASAGVGGVAATGGTSDAGVAGEMGAAGAGPEPCVPKPEVCDGLDNDCDDETDEEGCPADCTAKFYAGHSYLLCMTRDTDGQLAYNAATTQCEDASSFLDLSFDMALVRIESEEENDFLKDWIMADAPTDGAIWIGANDIEDENTWVWGRGPNAEQFFQGSNRGGGRSVDGAFNDFGTDLPNAANGDDEDCGAIDAQFDWHWNDVLCAKPRLGFLCEQKP